MNRIIHRSFGTGKSASEKRHFFMAGPAEGVWEMRVPAAGKAGRDAGFEADEMERGFPARQRELGFIPVSTER